MKKHFNLKTIISLMLALLMGLSAAVPAFAAGGSYTIKITSDEYTDTSKADRFDAYQVFSGVLTEGKENSRQLADIKWGSGVDGAALVSELMGGSDSFSNAFKEKLNDADEKYYAEVVANVLSENSANADFVHSFAKLAQKHKTSKSASSTFNDAEKAFEITVSDPGYYLVVDTTVSPADMNVVSAYILDVLGDQNINIKAEAPTVDKVIVNSSDDKEGVKGKAYEIGDEVTFRLVGKIPDYYASFDEYFYKFVDTLSEGLTYVAGSVVVTLRNTDNEIISTVASDKYSVVNTVENPQELTVTIPDLNSIDSIAKELEIVVEYKATLNDKAKIYTANENKVYLEFSNDPYNESNKGKTPESKVYVYTFGLDVTKQNPTGDMLDGVGFMLYKKVANAGTGKDDIVYASKFTEQTEGSNVVYKLDSESWVAADSEEDTSKGQELFTKNGGKLYIDGLSEGTYYLKETTKLNGYDTMKDIEIKVTPVIDESGNITNVEITIGNRLYKDDVTLSGLSGEGRDQLILINRPASFLPNTGGMGTVIFYVLGGIILAGAVIGIVVSKKSRKLRDQEQ